MDIWAVSTLGLLQVKPLPTSLFMDVSPEHMPTRGSADLKGKAYV